MKDIHKINNLKQVRLLSDPFKLSILQAFAEGERTTKEVAKTLKEPVTKLYRHVDALYDAGLLEITREKQKRGTVERHFQAVGKRFEVDHSLFAEGSDGEYDSVVDLFRSSELEVVDAIKSMSDGDPVQATLVKIRMRGSAEQLGELQRQLFEWVEAVQEDGDEAGEGSLEAGALIAFYPLPSAGEEPG
ncbi:MAG: helix-turn-helix domain-containing protein [Xanthomonadales bacterium]|nr:helix-turn-helix domain-containing protein [Xanthomonadales bacterium]